MMLMTAMAGGGGGREGMGVYFFQEYNSTGTFSHHKSTFMQSKYLITVAFQAF